MVRNKTPKKTKMGLRLQRESINASSFIYYFQLAPGLIYDASVPTHCRPLSDSVSSNNLS